MRGTGRGRGGGERERERERERRVLRAIFDSPASPTFRGTQEPSPSPFTYVSTLGYLIDLVVTPFRVSVPIPVPIPVHFIRLALTRIYSGYKYSILREEGLVASTPDNLVNYTTHSHTQFLLSSYPFSSSSLPSIHREFREVEPGFYSQTCRFCLFKHSNPLS